MFAPWKETYDKPRQYIKKQRHHFAIDKGPYCQSCGFSSSHVWMWELDHKESWAPKNWCFRIVMLEETLESLLDSREIKPVSPKGNQPWTFIGKRMLKFQCFGHLVQRANSLEKTLILGKIEGKRRRGRQSMRLLGSVTYSMTINQSQLWKLEKDQEAWLAHFMRLQSRLCLSD